LFCKASADSRRYVFHKIPKLVARFEEDGFIANDGTYSFELGIVGASSTTMQVLFCTDDDSFLEGAGDQTDKLASVQRTKAVNGEVWLSYPWTRIKVTFGCTHLSRLLLLVGLDALRSTFSVLPMRPAPSTIAGGIEPFSPDFPNPLVMRLARSGHRRRTSRSTTTVDRRTRRPPHLRVAHSVALGQLPQRH
jgi:hypothetical protein